METLVIDDDPISAELAAAMMVELDFTVTVAADADEGRRLLESTEAALVLVDWEMPGMSGIDFCRWVRRHFRQRYIYIIVVSGRHGAEAYRETAEAGADDYVCKPLVAHELRARIGTARRVVRLERELQNKHLRLSRAYDQLLDELIRTTSDLADASRLQQSRLPPAGRFGNVEACGILHPAAYNAGDAFDYFALDDDLFCFYVADVVGHGTTSAMTSYAVRHFMRSEMDGLFRDDVRRTVSLDEMVPRVLSDLNRSFHLDEEGNQWFTMLFGVVDQRSGLVTLSLGGHPPAIHVSRERASASRVGSGGFAVGMFEEATFDVEHCMLGPGDRLAIYSDGLLEALTDRGDSAAMEIVEEGMTRCLELPFERLSRELSDGVFGPDLRSRATDDVTLVVLEYAPAAVPATAPATVLEIGYELAELARVEGEAESLLQSLDTPDRRVGEIVVALSEAVCNVIRHGEGGDGKTIEVELAGESDSFRAVVVDRGTPMPDALRERIASGCAAMPAVSLDDIEGLPASGFGIGIILSAVTDVAYTVGEGGNRLDMRFTL